MTAKLLSNLEDDELMEKWTEAAQNLEDAKARVKNFSEEYQSRETERAARQKFDAMTEKERAALAQLVNAEGVESQETVGEESDNG